MGWKIKIGQGGTIRTQDRVVDIRVTEEFAHKEFVVTVQKPTQAERDQAKGRIDNAIIQIKRGSDIYIEGFIEDVELGQDIVKYSGRSFLVLLGYTTSSKTDGTSGATEAEYDDATGATIINDLINTFCVPNDAEITYTDVTFTETYGGEVKVHGKKVYDIVRNMCIDYSKDLWADATWNGDGINIDNKNIRVGTKSRGSAVTPHKTLYGGQHLKNIPTVKYRSSQNVINRIRVNGKGSGKEKVSVVVNDATSQTTYGVIEGSPYNNNMIVDEVTAEAVGQAIINAKKDLVEEVHLDLIIYISDLKYGDWVRISDSYSGVDTTQRIKKITRIYNSQQGESVNIEIGMPFDNYEMIIKDLTKGDVDEEPEMVKQGGALRLTANNPPEDWVRYDKGDWYDTTGTFQTHGKGAVPFWTYADNPATGTFKKALIQISNAGSVTYKVGTQYASKTDAQNESVSVDALNTPLGEVILKGKAVGGGGYTVEDVYSDDQGESYIYRDVRPIIGSSSTGYGGEPMWEVDGSETQLVTPDAIDMQGHDIIKISDLKGSLNSNFSLHGSNSADTDWIEFLQWDHSTEQILLNRNTDLYDASTISPRLKFRVPLDEGYSGIYIDYHSVDGMLRFRNITGDSDVVTFSDTGRVNLIGDLWMTKGKEINFGTPNTAYIYQDAGTNDLKFYDTVLGATKSLSELAAGGVPSGGIQGDIIYHDAADWVRLAAGTSGYVLQSQGAAANPVWAKGLPLSPVQGDVIYYNGSNWTRLAPGSSGSYLKTLGAGNNPIWFNVTAGFVTDPLSNNLDCNGNDINDIGDLDFRTSLSYAYINFDSGNDYLRYVCATDIFEFAIAGSNRLTIDTENINAYERLDMHNYDIINIDDLIFTGTSSYIDLNGGDIDDVDSIQAFDGSGIAIRNSGGSLKMEIGQTTDAFKVYHNINMNYHDLEQISYIDGRDNGNLYIRADPDGDSYNIHFAARGYTLFKLGYLDASHPYNIIQSSTSVPSIGSYYDIGTSTMKFDDLWCVDLHEGDCCYAETHCAKCGKKFEVGDNITHKVVEICKISGDTKTIPVHAECGNSPLKKVKLQRKVMEEFYGFNEDSGKIEIKYRKKTTKSLIEKIRLSKNVCIDPDTGKCYTTKKHYNPMGKEIGKEEASEDSYIDEVDLKSFIEERNETTDSLVFEEIEVDI